MHVCWGNWQYALTICIDNPGPLRGHCIVAIQQCFNYFVFAGKILNPFTVLQFRNDDCRGEDNLIGTCYSGKGKNLMHYLCMLNSMTSLLTHTVAHSTRPSYSPKVNNQPLKKFLSLSVSWIKVVKNGKILTFKVNFLCQKVSGSF